MRAVAKMAAILLLASATFAAAMVSTPAAAAQNTFGDDRIDFGGVNGTTEALRAVGDQIWVGGDFSQALDPDHTTAYARANLAVFDFNTGQVLPFAADTNDTVQAIESDDASTVWVAGDFSEIDGQNISHIAAFDAFTLEIDDSFSVVTDSEIRALHYSDGWLYLGGDFGQVNGLTYTKMARVDPLTGTLDTNFRPNPSETVRSIDSYGDRVYAAGIFDEVGSAPDTYSRRWVAGFDADTGQPAGPEFPFAGLQAGEQSHRAGLWRVHVSPDGDHLYTADRRNFITKWNRTTGQQLWQRRAEGDIQAVATLGDTVYAGTHEGLLDSSDQRLLFALDAADGNIDTSFDPLMNSYYGTYEITIAQGALVAAGDFTTVNGQSSPHLVVFHGPDWIGAQPLTPSFVLGDVSCDLTPDLGDALLIAQFSVGLRVQVPSCPLGDPTSQIGPGGDVDGNGLIDIGDALLIAQCSVGLTNIFCPQ